MACGPDCASVEQGQIHICLMRTVESLGGLDGMLHTTSMSQTSRPQHWSWFDMQFNRTDHTCIQAHKASSGKFKPPKGFGTTAEPVLAEEPRQGRGSHSIDCQRPINDFCVTFVGPAVGDTPLPHWRSHVPFQSHVSFRKQRSTHGGTVVESQTITTGAPMHTGAPIQQAFGSLRRVLTTYLEEYMGDFLFARSLMTCLPALSLVSMLSFPVSFWLRCEIFDEFCSPRMKM